MAQPLNTGSFGAQSCKDQSVQASALQLHPALQLTTTKTSRPVSFARQVNFASQAMGRATKRATAMSFMAGHLPGMSADLVAFDLRGVAHAGAGHDPVAALVFCQSADASLSVINGRVRVRDGRLVDVEIEPLLERHRALARRLYEAARHPHTA